jgi:hypothetical protein
MGQIHLHAFKIQTYKLVEGEGDIVLIVQWDYWIKKEQQTQWLNFNGCYLISGSSIVVAHMMVTAGLHGR